MKGMISLFCQEIEPMKMLSLLLIALSAALLLSLNGCASLSVPPGGSGNVVIVEGGLVETMVFSGKTTLNIQITSEHEPQYEYLVMPVLTIGRYSPVIGSGFTSRENIYYESTIGASGTDFFEVGPESYRVQWEEIDVLPGRRHPVSVFSVTVEQVAR